MKRKAKHRNLLPLIALAVVIAAIAVTQIPKHSDAQTPPASDSQIAESTFSLRGTDIVLNTQEIGADASHFDYEADGILVQLFAVQASDGTIRLALNTCQVCNGSPYAYFEQDGDWFTCQNCGNRFASAEIGIASGGCRPVPITEDIYSKEDGAIVIPTTFLEEKAPLFKNWKKF